MRVLVGVVLVGLLFTGCGGDDSSGAVSDETTTTGVPRIALELRPVVGSRPPPCAAPTPTPDTKGAACYALGPVLMRTPDFKNATPEFDTASNAWAVTLTVRTPALKRWHEIVDTYVNQQVAIVIDGKVAMAPVINPGITGSDVQITATGPRPKPSTSPRPSPADAPATFWVLTCASNARM